MGYTSWQNWDNIISYIKDEMGHDVMSLELSDTQIVEKIQNHVLPEFSAWDGLHRYYKMTEDNIISWEPVLTYEFKDFPYKIFEVKNIVHNATYVDLDHIFSQSIVGDVTDFLIRQNYVDMSRMVKADNTWRFLPPNQFQLTKAGFTNITNEFILVLDCVHNDPSTISPGLYDSFRDLATSYIMNVIGRIRKKYNNFNTPFGNIQLNADELIQEAKEIRMRTLEELKRTPPEQYIYNL
jgi:hypothetical protein